ncbi:MAG: BrnT family toxin [Burkholderiaceae bacterium]|nr:BrnT family toxin [Burkholderiaceae bacterium]
MSFIELQSGSEFEWDRVKSDACFDRRGFDFAYALRAFLDPHRVVTLDDRWDYGEDRYRLFGAIEGRVYCLAFTVRGERIRIISARRANRREVGEYEHSTRQGRSQSPDYPAQGQGRSPQAGRDD